MKPRFEVIPGSPKLQAIFEVGRLAKQEHLEINALHDDDNQYRFQLWIENVGIALDKPQHEKFLGFLLEQSDVVTEDNSEVIVQPGGAVNIVISF